jgi:hypothetical protein
MDLLMCLCLTRLFGSVGGFALQLHREVRHWSELMDGISKAFYPSTLLPNITDILASRVLLIMPDTFRETYIISKFDRCGHAHPVILL